MGSLFFLSAGDRASSLLKHSAAPTPTRDRHLRHLGTRLRVGPCSTRSAGRILFLVLVVGHPLSCTIAIELVVVGGALEVQITPPNVPRTTFDSLLLR